MGIAEPGLAGAAALAAEAAGSEVVTTAGVGEVLFFAGVGSEAGAAGAFSFRAAP